MWIFQRSSLLTLSLLVLYSILPGKTIGSRLHRIASAQKCKQRVDAAAKRIPALGSFLVWKDGQMVFEGYYHGADSNTVFSIKSATKTFLSAIAGAAQIRGLLPDINTPVLKVLPEYDYDRGKSGVWFRTDLNHDDSIRRTLTLGNLLSMQTGFTWDDFGESGQTMCNARDPVQFTLDLPFDTIPGTEFNYCSGGAIVFGVALARCVNTDLLTFADTSLFQPAGIRIDHWDTDPLGRYNGTSEIFMTARNMLRFGLLFLNGGRSGERQLLTKAWIEQSTSAHAKLDHWDVLPGADGYGYFWWRRKSHEHQVWVASGYGGQLICVIPDLNTVISTTCTLGDENRGRSEIRRLHKVIDQLVPLFDSTEN